MAKLPNGLSSYNPPQFECLSETPIAIGVHSSGNTIYKKIMKFKTSSTVGQTAFSLGSRNILDFKGICWYYNTRDKKMCQCPIPWVGGSTDLVTFCTNRQNNSNYLNIVVANSDKTNLNCIVEVTYY